MKKIFEESKISSLSLENRLIRSATWEGMCDERGYPTPKLIQHTSNLASGGVGLLISGYTYVNTLGKQLPGKMGLYSDESSDSMEKYTTAIHDAGGKICLQLVHAGGQTDKTNAGGTPVAPSSLELEQYPERPDELSVSSIEEIIHDFGKSAERAKRYGFDAIQLHAAHGYLINQFLSPLTNKRKDSYGGNSKNRNRFLLETFMEVRAKVGRNFPILAKINCSDFVEGGITLDDSIFTASLLDDAGIDAIEISGGTTAAEDKGPARQDIKTVDKEAYHLGFATEIKNSVSCPIIVVGGFRSTEIIEKDLNQHNMDYVSLSRPFIREPCLPNRWKDGDYAKAKCISCNGCFKPGLAEKGIRCVLEKN